MPILPILFYQLIILILAMAAYGFYFLAKKDEDDETGTTDIPLIPFEKLDHIRQAAYIWEKAKYVTITRIDEVHYLVYQLGKEYKYAFAEVVMNPSEEKIILIRKLEDDELEKFLPELVLD